MKTDKIKITPLQAGISRGRLTALGQVPLLSPYPEMLAAAMKSSTGPTWWRRRKEIEAYELLALAQISGRVVVLELELTESIRAIVQGDLPVPRLPEGANAIEVARNAVLAIRYPEVAVHAPQPGFAFVQVLGPDRVWLANVAPGRVQALCLGATIPAAIPLRDLLIMSFGALSMQTVMLDERDHAGVLNAVAARWWQERLPLMPLTREPFIRAIGQA
ncbi:MAG: hypothetical protein ACHRHE_23160 [Tepidisphaerales bacterium]